MIQIQTNEKRQVNVSLKKSQCQSMKQKCMLRLCRRGRFKRFHVGIKFNSKVSDRVAANGCSFFVPQKNDRKENQSQLLVCFSLDFGLRFRCCATSISKTAVYFFRRRRSAAFCLGLYFLLSSRNNNDPFCPHFFKGHLPQTMQYCPGSTSAQLEVYTSENNGVVLCRDKIWSLENNAGNKRALCQGANQS